LARPAKADYVPLMIELVSKKLLKNEEVKIADIAIELNISSALVHFYFNDLKTLTDAAWQNIFMRYVDDDISAVDNFAPGKNWEGVKELIDQIFSQERDLIHFAHEGYGIYYPRDLIEKELEMILAGRRSSGQLQGFKTGNSGEQRKRKLCVHRQLARSQKGVD
jgi:hypothetical protein